MPLCCTNGGVFFSLLVALGPVAAFAVHFPFVGPPAAFLFLSCCCATIARVCFSRVLGWLPEALVRKIGELALSFIKKSVQKVGRGACDCCFKKEDVGGPLSWHFDLLYILNWKYKISWLVIIHWLVIILPAVEAAHSVLITIQM